MKIYDISMTINDKIFVYKNRAEKKPIFNTKKNGYVFETTLTLDLHTGTHIDAPLHMIEDGATIIQYDLQRFITKAQVLDFTNVNENITENDLKDKNIKEDHFIILKTKNSFKDYFDFDFIYLEKSGAEYLSKKLINGVGIDALGIERNQPNHDTHKALLNNNIVILEGLRLADVEAGDYLLIALPLKLNDSEAAPTRAVLVENFKNN